MRNCKRIEEKLAEYYYDELSGPEKAEVAAHLESCGSCRAEYESIQKVLAEASRMSGSRPKLSEAFWNNYMAELKEKIRQRKKAPAFSHLKFPAAAAVAALLVLGFFAYRKPAPAVQELDAAYFIAAASQDPGGELADIELDLLADPELNEEILFEPGG
jgi:anti-sigma factor RsiW